MSTISLKLNNQQIARLKTTFKNNICPNNNPYIDTFISRDDVTISIYKSGKVVFQGQEAHYYGSSFIETTQKAMAGSDEVGTGDFFGPIIVCAAIIQTSDYERLEALGIRDSKALNDEQIKKIVPTLLKDFAYSLLILDNSRYNEVNKTNNLNAIKAKMHNQAYLNLINKGYELPKAAYVDQFCPEDLYYRYLKDEKQVYHELTFETKAEDKYLAVALASCIARYAFLVKMEEMEMKYGFHFHKGASDLVDEDGRRFVEKFGKAKLKEVAKLNFKNTERILM